MTVVTDIERTIEFVPDPVKTPEEEDIEAYNEMVRLTLDPWWYSTAYHEISSARLTHEFLDQRVQMRKNLLMRQTKMWNVEDDTPYLYHWQMQLADKLLMPPSPLWVPTKRVVPLLPDDAMRLTTTFESMNVASFCLFLCLFVSELFLPDQLRAKTVSRGL